MAGECDYQIALYPGAPAAAQIIIPAKTVCTTKVDGDIDAILFETMSDLILTMGQTIGEVDACQGTRQTDIMQATGKVCSNTS